MLRLIDVETLALDPNGSSNSCKAYPYTYEMANITESIRRPLYYRSWRSSLMGEKTSAGMEARYRRPKEND